MKLSRIAFLLGAGASRDAGLPDVRELVESFIGNKRLKNRRVLSDVYTALKRSHDVVDVELLLDAFDQLAVRQRQVLSAFVSSEGWIRAATASPSVYLELRDALYAHIRTRLALAPGAVDYYGALVDLAVIEGGLDVFSLNYDLAVELACLVRGEAWTDGFDPRWNPNQFSAVSADGGHSRFRVRLHKMHGSLVWHRLENGEIEKVAVSPARSAEVRHFSGSRLEEALIYPAAGGKDVHSDPYATLVERFRATLRAAETLVAVGYSFRDRHIKSVVTEAMVVNRRLRLVVVDPSAHEVLKRSDETTHSNSSFHSLSGQVQLLPRTAKDALASEDLRNTLAALDGLRHAEDALLDGRRRDAPARVQTLVRNP